MFMIFKYNVEYLFLLKLFLIDSLLKVIDIYDNMTIKQKKMIDLTDREYTLAIECLALTKD